MSGPLASLRDWLLDQVREVQQLTPLAVLEPLSAPSHQTGPRRPTASTSAPAQTKPVAVPSIEDMPSGDTSPRCQDDLLSDPDRICDAPAVVLISLRMHCAEYGCRRTALTLCAAHRDELHQYLRDELPAVCRDCGAEANKVSDIIVAEYPL